MAYKSVFPHSGGSRGRGPRPHGPHPSPLGACAQTRCCFAALLRLAFVPPRRLRRRRRCCALRVRHSPRCAWLRPLRRARPARAVASLPPAPALGPCARLRAPWALAGPVCLRRRSRCAAGFLFGRPCCARACGLCSACPRGGLACVPSGFARARSGPPPARAVGALFPASRGAGSGFLRACACARLLPFSCGCGRCLLPASPPAPAAPLGLSGSARPPA